MFKENKGTAYGRALKLLSKQDYSEFGIRSKLESVGFDKDQIDQAIVKIKQENFLREDRYFKNQVRKLIYKGHPPSFILQKLKQEKIFTDLDQILLVFDEEGIKPINQIKQLVKKKLPQNFESPKSEIEREKLIKKLLQFILAKGHDFDEIQNHLENNF